MLMADDFRHIASILKAAIHELHAGRSMRAINSDIYFALKECCLATILASPLTPLSLYDTFSHTHYRAGQNTMLMPLPRI